MHYELVEHGMAITADVYFQQVDRVNESLCRTCAALENRKKKKFYFLWWQKITNYKTKRKKKKKKRKHLYDTKFFCIRRTKRIWEQQEDFISFNQERNISKEAEHSETRKKLKTVFQTFFRRKSRVPLKEESNIFTPSNRWKVIHHYYHDPVTQGFPKSATHLTVGSEEDSRWSGTTERKSKI